MKKKEETQAERVRRLIGVEPLKAKYTTWAVYDSGNGKTVSINCTYADNGSSGRFLSRYEDIAGDELSVMSDEDIVNVLEDVAKDTREGK